ncbi:MAG: hypothetical protein ABI882_02860 [Acidobacteriota bacterium]
MTISSAFPVFGVGEERVAAGPNLETPRDAVNRLEHAESYRRSIAEVTGRSYRLSFLGDERYDVHIG